MREVLVFQKIGSKTSCTAAGCRILGNTQIIGEYPGVNGIVRTDRFPAE
jgi:hypothetical protein